MNTTLATVLVAAVVTPSLVLVSTAIVKWMGRWFTAAVTASFEDVVQKIVKDTVEPHLAGISTQMTVMRDENARDHAEVSSRLNALEARVALVEARLTPIDTTAPQGG